MNVSLVEFQNEAETAVSLIRQFWKAHNGHEPTAAEAGADLDDWTREGQRLYLIRQSGEAVGFVHLGSRGAELDWLEDIFVLPEHQGKGIGTYVIGLVEAVVREYSDSLYIEAAARNEKAIRLYHRIGYDCLNTVTVRKDFYPDKLKTVGRESLFGLDFSTKKYKD